MPGRLDDLFKKKDPGQSPGPPPGPPVDPPRAAAPSRLGDLFAKKQEAAGPPDTPEGPKPEGNFFTTSLLKHTTGSTATEQYEKFVKTLLPESIRKSKGDNWMSRFVLELGKAGPELLDFASSPVGMAMIAGHMFPATAPFFAAGDVALGLVSGVQSFPLVGKALSEGSPESWAEAIKSIAMSSAMVFGGGKMLAGKALSKYHTPPLAERTALRQALTAAPDEAKIPMLEQAKAAAPQPRGIQKLYDQTGGKNLARMLQVPKPLVLQTAADVVFDRATLIAERTFDTNAILYDLKREIPKGDREVQKLGYVIQGDATPDEVGLSKQAREWLPKIREWTKEQDKLLRDHDADVSLLDPEHYLTQIWDKSSLEAAGKRRWTLPDPDQAPLPPTAGDPFQNRVSRTRMHDPFLKQRTFDSYKEGIEKFGLKPRFTDVADILKHRADMATQVIANRRMAGMLRDLGVIVTQDEAEGLKLTSWKRASEAPALNRATYAGNTEQGQPYFERRPVYVHPDFESSINAVFGKGIQTPGFAALDTIRALAKRSMFSFSLFHHNALSEQGQAIFTLRKPVPGIGQATAKGVRAGDALRQTFAFNPHFQSGVKSAFMKAFGREGDRPPILRIEPEMAKDALRAGLNLNSEEREGWVIQKMRDLSVSSNWFARATGRVAKPLAGLMEAHDSALWDYYHQGSMLDGFYTVLADEMTRLPKDATPSQVQELQRTVADHINNAYGAISFEKMLLSPVARQVLNFSLLAPAWTLSNIGVLAKGFESAAGARIAKKYIGGAAISWFTATQMLNYALSGYYKTEDKHGKKGAHFSWDNPGPPAKIGNVYLDGLSTNAFNISVGKNPNGSQRYLVLGKGFREPYAGLMSPLETYGNKIGVYPRMLMVLATGSSPGSGYQEIDPKASKSDQFAQGAMAVGESLGVPLAARNPLMHGAHALFPSKVKAPSGPTLDTVQLLGFPTKSGMTLTSAVRAYTDAIEDNRLDVARQVLSDAARNKIDPGAVIRTSKQDRRKKQKQIAGPAVTYDTFGNKVQR